MLSLVHPVSSFFILTKKTQAAILKSLVLTKPAPEWIEILLIT
jgi:hypothetical protein